MNRAEMTTYKRADGELIGDYAWVGELDYFEEDWWAPVEVIEEIWERKSERKFWHFPGRLYDCDVTDCDEDAVVWEQDSNGIWQQVCKQHRSEEGQP